MSTYHYYNEEEEENNNSIKPEVYDAPINKYATTEWLAFRDKVLTYMPYCVECGYTYGLHVHHPFYVQGHDVHEYDIDDMLVLCSECHRNYHEKPEDFPSINRISQKLLNQKITKLCVKSESTLTHDVDGLLRSRWTFPHFEITTVQSCINPLEGYYRVINKYSNGKKYYNPIVHVATTSPIIEAMQSVVRLAEVVPHE
jgi:hypothetical protein